LAENKNITKQISRRRVFLFIFAFLFIGMLLDVMAELDVLAYALDDIAIVSLSAIGILLMAYMRKDTSSKKLELQNNIMLVLVVAMILFQIVGIFVELKSPEDFGDDIPVLIGLVLALVNRFW
jgi:hypothetical protein